MLTHLAEVGEVSLRNVADENFRKSLLLAAASYFEYRMKETVLTFVNETTNRNVLVTALVQNKVVVRQYHTWFNWEGNNANQFFSLFGREFREFMEGRIEATEELDDAIRAFLELGKERNRLVHQNYGGLALEKTTDEIHILYRRAMNFVEMVPTALREFKPSNDT